VDDRYRLHLLGSAMDIAPTYVGALDEGDYQVASEAGLGRQRVAAYRYAARHLLRYPPSVLVSLIGTTVTNKWRAVVASERKGGT
jgi:hypothetical protein